MIQSLWIYSTNVSDVSSTVHYHHALQGGYYFWDCESNANHNNSNKRHWVGHCLSFFEMQIITYKLPVYLKLLRKAQHSVHLILTWNTCSFISILQKEEGQ